MRWSERRQRFRALLAGDRCIHPASNDELKALTRDADYRRWTDDWLGGD